MAGACLAVALLATAVSNASAGSLIEHPCASGTTFAATLAGGDGDGFRVTGDAVPNGFAGLTYTLAGLASDTPLPLPKPGTDITLAVTGDVLDRYRRAPAHVFAGGRWLQADRLGKAGAFADPSSASPACRDALLAAEGKTTSIPAWKPEQVAERTGRFAVVTGRVESIGDRSTRLYLNFGLVWTKDFTVMVAKKGRNRYRGDLQALQALAGQRVTVRGTVESNGGPLLRLLDESQIFVHENDG